MTALDNYITGNYGEDQFKNIFSHIVCGDFGLCSDGKWRHRGFHNIGTFNGDEVEYLLDRWEQKGISIDSVKIIPAKQAGK